MDEHFKGIVLIFVSFVVYKYDVICGEFSPLSENYITCLLYAAKFHDRLLTFCNGTSPDLSVWHQKHEECNRICTIKSQNVSCSNRDKAVISRFQFDINLPVNVFRAGKCKSCFNVTHITITCKLNQTSMKSEPKTTQNGEIFTAEMKSKSSGDKVEIIVAAVLSGAVFGALITIGIWILKQKLSIELWKRRSTVHNPTNNDSSRSSNPQPKPAVSLENQYLDIVPLNNQSYTPKEESAIYNHLNEKTDNTEDTDSPYDHAQYQKNQPDTILDSDYMHINKL